MDMQITFDFGGKNYCLEFSRQVAVEIAKQGFDPKEALCNFALYGPLVFYWSLETHHPYISQEETDYIYQFVDDKEELLKSLLYMYVKAIEEEVNDLLSCRGTTNKVKWKKNWDNEWEE